MYVDVRCMLFPPSRVFLGLSLALRSHDQLPGLSLANPPLGRVSRRVAMSVYIYVCLYVRPLPVIYIRRIEEDRGADYNFFFLNIPFFKLRS